MRQPSVQGFRQGLPLREEVGGLGQRGFLFQPFCQVRRITLLFRDLQGTPVVAVCPVVFLPLQGDSGQLAAGGVFRSVQPVPPGELQYGPEVFLGIVREVFL